MNKLISCPSSTIPATGLNPSAPEQGLTGSRITIQTWCDPYKSITLSSVSVFFLLWFFIFDTRGLESWTANDGHLSLSIHHLFTGLKEAQNFCSDKHIFTSAVNSDSQCVSNGDRDVTHSIRIYFSTLQTGPALPWFYLALWYVLWSFSKPAFPSGCCH